MTAEVVSRLVRDTVLEQRMLEAVIADRNDQPRNKQVQVGPSSIGFCRELLRASLFEPESVSEPEPYWAAAAHVGSVMGDDLERIFGQRLDAMTQQRITTVFDRLGLQISGAMDLVFLDVDSIADLKSTDDIGGVIYDLEKNAAAIETLLSIWQEGALFSKNVETAHGGYELTSVMVSKISKLHYYIQISVYVTGAIQAGILSPDAGGRLVFYDRGGNFQEFVALVVSPQEIAMFYEIAQLRVEQVARAQEAYEGTNGNPAVIAHLRDQMPSFCFSPKVMCPRRMHCWGGSDWAPENDLRGAEVSSAVDRYVRGRQLAKIGDGMKKSAREELREVNGTLPDGRMVSWVRGGSTINVVETTRAEPSALLDTTVQQWLMPREGEPGHPNFGLPKVLLPEELEQLVSEGGPEGDEAAELLAEGEPDVEDAPELDERDPAAGHQEQPITAPRSKVAFKVDHEATRESQERLAAMQAQVAAERKARQGAREA